MANITSNKALLEQEKKRKMRGVEPRLSLPPLTRTGLLPPKDETGFTVEGMGPITPLPSPQAQAPGAKAAPAGPTPIAPGVPGADAGTLPPLDPTILRSAETTPEMAAFKAALDSPAPVFTKVGFTIAERAALGFLAGLKGIDAVMPIIEQRRKEASDIYQKAVEARGERLDALFKLGQISTQAREVARTNAEQERAAQFERTKFAESKRQFGISQQEKAREFDLRQKELNESQAQRLAQQKQPTLPAIQEYNDTNSALGSIRQIRRLIKAGRGGPAQQTAAAVGNFIPGMSGMDFVSENRELVAELANLNSIFGPGRLGANIPAGEREIIEGVLRNPRSSQGDVLRAVAVVERHMNPLREQLLRRYDFGTVSAPADPEGLTPTMRREVDDLTAEGYQYVYNSPKGNRVYQRGSELVEVIPDAH